MNKQDDIIFKAFYAAVVCFFTSSTLFLFNTFYNVQKTPFIDEVFHIPQAQKYCEGLFFEWDSKITTLPGLYLLSVGVLQPLSSLTSKNLCSVYALRATNVVVSILNFYLFYVLTSVLQINKSYKEEIQWKNLMTALNLSLFPVLYFFTFLYYTDSLSTCLVLLAYLLHLQNRNFLSAFVGFICILVRQTNIVWIFLFALDLITEVIKAEALSKRKVITPDMETKIEYIEVLGSTVSETCERGSYHISHLIGRIIGHAFSYFLVGVSFVLFYLINGGIVVGDKSAHVPVLNIPQMFYFSLFTLAFASPFAVVKVEEFYHFVVSNLKNISLLCLLCIFVVSVFTHVHPYLLADNRHYTFYIWKRIYDRLEFRYGLIPVYIFGMYFINSALNRCHAVFKVGFWICLTLSIVPQRLFEFRYFIIPYLLLRLQVQSPKWWQLIAELIIFVIINAITVYLFVKKTFYWSDSTEPQRIIW